MAEAKEKTVEERLAALEAENALLRDKVAALESGLETLMSQPAPAAGEAVTRSPKTPVQLTGETFKVAGKTYRLRFPIIHFKGRDYTEAEVLASKEVQKGLVEGGFKVIEEA